MGGFIRKRIERLTESGDVLSMSITDARLKDIVRSTLPPFDDFFFFRPNFLPFFTFGEKPSPNDCKTNFKGALPTVT